MSMFRQTWSKIWIYNVLKEQIDFYLRFAMLKFEINKRIFQLIEQRKVI